MPNKINKNYQMSEIGKPIEKAGFFAVCATIILDEKIPFPPYRYVVLLSHIFP